MMVGLWIMWAPDKMISRLESLGVSLAKKREATTEESASNTSYHQYGVAFFGRDDACNSPNKRARLDSSSN